MYKKILMNLFLCRLLQMKRGYKKYVVCVMSTQQEVDMGVFPKKVKEELWCGRHPQGKFYKSYESSFSWRGFMNRHNLWNRQLLTKENLLFWYRNVHLLTISSSIAKCLKFFGYESCFKIILKAHFLKICYTKTLVCPL